MQGKLEFKLKLGRRISKRGKENDFDGQRRINLR